MRIDPAEYRRLPLRAHALLRDVPLHDVWAVDLPGGGPERTLDDVRKLLSVDRLASASGAVRFLFGLRALLGRLFGWDREPPGVPAASFLHRLPEVDRAGSRVPPGTRDGPFRVLYVHADESAAEVINDTVHAFSVMALVTIEGGYRLFWAIYVLPVGRITPLYMALIDPFRRWIVYPTILRRVRRGWSADGASGFGGDG